MIHNFFLSKKAEKLISVYWFIILTLVAGGVFIMVNNFYNSPYDVREVESNLLADKVIDCFYQGGQLSPLLLSSTKEFRDSFRDNFMGICSLTFDTRQEWDPKPHYVEVVFYGDSRKINTLYNFSSGNRNYKEDCFAQEKHKGLAQCSIKNFYVVSKEGKTYFVEVLAATGKTQENV
jgi:hypothetical protein